MGLKIKDLSNSEFQEFTIGLTELCSDLVLGGELGYQEMEASDFKEIVAKQITSKGQPLTDNQPEPGTKTTLLS